MLKDLLRENFRLRLEGARLTAEIFLLRVKLLGQKIWREILLLEHWLLIGELPRE